MHVHMSSCTLLYSEWPATDLREDRPCQCRCSAVVRHHKHSIQILLPCATTHMSSLCQWRMTIWRNGAIVLRSTLSAAFKSMIVVSSPVSLRRIVFLRPASISTTHMALYCIHTAMPMMSRYAHPMAISMSPRPSDDGGETSLSINGRRTCIANSSTNLVWFNWRHPAFCAS